jgi:hypothetical protein
MLNAHGSAAYANKVQKLTAVEPPSVPPVFGAPLGVQHAGDSSAMRMLLLCEQHNPNMAQVAATAPPQYMQTNHLTHGASCNSTSNHHSTLPQKTL